MPHLHATHNLLCMHTPLSHALPSPSPTASPHEQAAGLKQAKDDRFTLGGGGLPGGWEAHTYHCHLPRTAHMLHYLPAWPHLFTHTHASGRNSRLSHLPLLCPLPAYVPAAPTTTMQHQRQQRCKNVHAAQLQHGKSKTLRSVALFKRAAAAPGLLRRHLRVTVSMVKKRTVPVISLLGGRQRKRHLLMCLPPHTSMRCLIPACLH